MEVWPDNDIHEHGGSHFRLQYTKADGLDLILVYHGLLDLLSIHRHWCLLTFSEILGAVHAGPLFVACVALLGS